MPEARAGTVLAFDYGERYVGVAVGDEALALAHPLDTIETRDPDARLAAVAARVAEWAPQRLVVGLPLSMDGKPHALTAQARAFAQALEGRFRLPVSLVDERLSSADAQTRLREQGRGGRKHKALAHPAAAQVILQDYFDAHATS
jgi:putative Holliday junction resolvase